MLTALNIRTNRIIFLNMETVHLYLFRLPKLHEILDPIAPPHPSPVDQGLPSQAQGQVHAEVADERQVPHTDDRDGGVDPPLAGQFVVDEGGDEEDVDGDEDGAGGLGEEFHAEAGAEFTHQYSGEISKFVTYEKD